jgi:hypothetical protein
MKRTLSARLAATVMYCVLAAYPFSVIAVWLLTPPRSALADALSPEGAMALFLSLLILGFGSLVVVAGLLIRGGHKSARILVLLVIGAVLIGVGAWWGLMAFLLYGLGFLLLTQAYRDARTPNPALNTDAGPSASAG